MASQHPALRIAALAASDCEWANALLIERWGGTKMITRGQAHDCSALPGFVAWHGDHRTGLIIYRLEELDCEIISLDSLLESAGIGTALLNAVETVARDARCQHVWLITTNDNLHALGFYQRRGYRLAAVYPNAVDDARRHKPEIPLLGLGNIPLHDEIELHKSL